MNKFVFIVCALIVPALAAAVTVTPIITNNTDIDWASERISSSGGTACKRLTICNQGTAAGANLFVQNSSTVTYTTAIRLYPTAATAAGTNCVTLDAGSTRGKNESDTIDATAWYALAPVSNIPVQMICIP